MILSQESWNRPMVRRWKRLSFFISHSHFSFLISHFFLFNVSLLRGFSLLTPLSSLLFCQELWSKKTLVWKSQSGEESCTEQRFCADSCMPSACRNNVPRSSKLCFYTLTTVLWGACYIELRGAVLWVLRHNTKSYTPKQTSPNPSKQRPVS